MKSVSKLVGTMIAATLSVAAIEATPVVAATFDVTTTADSGVGSLRQAITDANNDSAAGTDIIAFASDLTGTIALTSGSLSINLANPTNHFLDIVGPGANLLTVSRLNTSNPIFVIASGSTVGISGLNILSPVGTGGIDILNNGMVTVNNSTISGASTGILNNGTATVTSSTISGNSTEGIYNATFLARATVTNSTISNNRINGITNLGDITVINSTISGNTADGIANILSTLSGASSGGLVLENSTLYNNGNGIEGGRSSVLNSTISNNRNSGIQGDSSGIASIGNTIIAKNSFADILIGTGVFDLGYNLIGKGDERSFFAGQNGVNGDIVGTTANPVDPKLGPLADNGGPTLTQALLPGSPAIDAGSNALISPGVTTDQRGPGFNRISNGRVDIGAFEVQAQARSVPEPTSTLAILAFGSVVGTSFVLKRQLKK